MAEKVLFTWSSGKDSAIALYELQKGGRYEIAALLTTVTGDYDRVSMHGVRRALLEEQAKSIGIPLETVLIGKDASNDEYESKMRDMLLRYQRQGVASVAFGDVFLEDLKRYREVNLARIGMNGLFPVWGRDTTELARTFIDLGFKAVVTCVDSNALGKEFVGREFDDRFLADLPSTVDPCGENGEFHSFVYAGPIFRQPIAHEKGEIVLRANRFHFCDIILRRHSRNQISSPPCHSRACPRAGAERRESRQRAPA